MSSECATIASEIKAAEPVITEIREVLGQLLTEDRKVAGMSLVEMVLAVDNAHRRPGVTEGLHRFESLSVRDWDFSSPTLVKKIDEEDDLAYHRVALQPSVEEFRRVLFDEHPLLARLNLANVLVAGGAVGACVMRREARGRVPQVISTSDAFDGDVDLFIYGLDRAQANKRVVELHDNLINAARSIAVDRVIAPLAASMARDNVQRRREHRQMEVQRVTSEALRNSASEALRNSGFRVHTVYPTSSPADVKEEPVDDEKELEREVRIMRAFLARVPWIRTEDKLPPMMMLDRKQLGKTTASLADYEISYSVPSIVKIRNKRCLTLKIGDNHRIQIIFRLYTSPSEILHGFDLGTSAVGYDGTDVWFTSLGRFTYEYGCLIADTARRSTTFEARLLKYWNRGFNLVLPHLDMASLPTRYFKWRLAEVAELPFFPFSYTAAANNRITVDKILIRGGQSSDYGPKIENENDIPEWRIAEINLKHILQGSDDLYYTSRRGASMDVANDADPVLAGPPHISLTMVHDIYDKARRWIYRSGKFDLGILRRFFPEELVDFGDHRIAPIIQSVLAGEPVKDKLDALIQNQRTVAVRAFLKAIDQWDSSIPWITDNPGTQLTSSVNPIIASPSDWYGVQHYSKNL